MSLWLIALILHVANLADKLDALLSLWKQKVVGRAAVTRAAFKCSLSPFETREVHQPISSLLGAVHSVSCTLERRCVFFLPHQGGFAPLADSQLDRLNSRRKVGHLYLCGVSLAELLRALYNYIMRAFKITTQEDKI